MWVEIIVTVCIHISLSAVVFCRPGILILNQLPWEVTPHGAFLEFRKLHSLHETAATSPLLVSPFLWFGSMMQMMTVTTARGSSSNIYPSTTCWWQRIRETNIIEERLLSTDKYSPLTCPIIHVSFPSVLLRDKTLLRWEDCRVCHVVHLWTRLGEDPFGSSGPFSFCQELYSQFLSLYQHSLCRGEREVLTM